MSQQYQKQKKKWYNKGKSDRDKEILEYINRLEIIKKNIKEIQDNLILMNELNKWIKELEK